MGREQLPVRREPPWLPRGEVLLVHNRGDDAQHGPGVYVTLKMDDVNPLPKLGEVVDLSAYRV